MEIKELHTITESSVEDFTALMKELDSEILVSSEMLKCTVETPGSHLFAMIDDGHIIGCGTLCVCSSPTGKKAHIEDVVVLSSYRGRHFGKNLVEHIIDYARKELVNVDLYLTSRLHRVAANEMYKTLGFKQKETNVYKMTIK